MAGRNSGPGADAGVRAPDNEPTGVEAAEAEAPGGTPRGWTRQSCIAELRKPKFSPRSTLGLCLGTAGAGVPVGTMVGR